MGPFEMVVAIVLIVTIGQVARAKFGGGRSHHHRDGVVHDATIMAENQRLRDELRGLKDRVAVLERLATDDASSLDREIEKLRDRSRDRDPV